MRRGNKWVFIIWLIFSFQLAIGQDTLKLSHQEYLSIVQSYHPVLKSFRLQNQIAEEEIRRARGNFDPFLSAKNAAKNIEGINYYRETNAGFEIPTWYGIEVNGDYNRINGLKLDNSETVGGLYQFGVTIPLAKKLLYDKRRALLDQAKFAKQMTSAEQFQLKNDVLLEAENTYWEWVKEYENYELKKRVLTINKERFRLIKKSYEFGELAAIDTTETQAQLLNIELQQQDAYLKFVKATQELSLFLWKENQQPYEISSWLIPVDSLNSNQAYSNYASLINEVSTHPIQNHTSLQFYKQKQLILESERKLKQQSLLPKVDFTYNFLNKANYPSNFLPIFQNNYQYAIKFEMPILMRQARADIQIAKAKILQNRFQTDYKQQTLKAKLNSNLNEVVNYRNQIELASRNMTNYRRLLSAEEIKLNNGESSLFLMNSRENKWIESQEKLLELRLKFIESYNKLKWMNESFKWSEN